MEARLGFPECSSAELEECMASFRKVRTKSQTDIELVEKVANALELITRKDKSQVDMHDLMNAVKLVECLDTISKVTRIAANAHLTMLQLLGIVEKACQQEIDSRKAE